MTSSRAISLIAVQSDAASKILPRDPARVAEPLATIQATARGALAEMRSLVGLLRISDEAAPLGPQAGAGDLERLVADACRSGLPVTLAVLGEVRPLPATLDLAAYRIVQEGLTNVRKHAGPATARVTVEYRPDCLAVEVCDDGRAGGTPNGGGYGLVGIRERVVLLGGRIESGPAENGGFALRATLPVEGQLR